MNDKLSFENIRNSKEIQTYLEYTDKAFALFGYKDHGKSHSSYCADTAEQILKYLGYEKREQELAKIAAYLHDIGSVVSKRGHGQSGALMFLNFLDLTSYDEESFAVASAIGCHEDKNTDPVSPIAAALVLGDKTDVRRERIRDTGVNNSDKHSKVIAACQQVNVIVDKEKMTIDLSLAIDAAICSVMDYFEIFMARTNFCRRACRVLNCNFELHINQDKFL
ncbi:MAG: HD domain-containing protein [Endomicrobium sp.]|jgi:metal-dependent HD superfamily phosphatase/phosphodiesterase|nr:HD domain-containing protein [Endomicrobium sp.]